MKRKIALIIVSLMIIMSVNAVASVTGEREYSFADDSASVITNITVKEDTATLDVYVSGGIYGFTGLSIGYEYDTSALTLLNTDKVQRGQSKLDIGGKWLESFSANEGQILYIISSTGEFASYKNGESEKLFSLEFKINKPSGEDSISYLADANVITCGDTNIYLNPKTTGEKMLDGSSIFKLTKDFIPDKIEITDKTYSDVNTIYMAIGKTKQLYIKSQKLSEILWGGTGDVATVSENGVVTALSAGKSTITAFDFFGNSDSINIIVQETKVWPEEIKIVCPDTLMVGDMIRPEYKIYPANSTETDVIWSIEKGNAALIADDPIFLALSSGNAALKATVASDEKVYAETEIKIVSAPKSSEKVVDGSFLVPEKLYAKPGKETVFDITPKLFNIAGSPIAKDVYSKVYDIEYTAENSEGITFENGILTISPDAPEVTEMSISAVVKYKLDGKVAIHLESNKFKVFNSKLTDVKIENTKVKKGNFTGGIYEVTSDNFKVLPIADGRVYSTEIKNGNVTDMYFFSSDKKGVLGYNFDYMVKHIRIQVVK